MNKVNEMFGLYTNGAVFPDLHTALREQTCPYMNGAQVVETDETSSAAKFPQANIPYHAMTKPTMEAILLPLL